LTDDSKKSAPAHIWNGLFETWEQACAAAPERGSAFLSERWINRIIQQLQEYRDLCLRYDIALPPRPSNLPWVCAMTRPRSIVDFGGSSGWCYDYLQKTLRDHSVSSYVIVEIEHIVERMIHAELHSAPVTYKTATDSLDRCDLLYCNSVLQYFESNTALLDLVERVGPQYILLDDLLAKGKEDFFSTQAYYETAIPHRFLGLQRLFSDMSSIGYHLLLSAPFASPVLALMKPLPMENFPEAFQLRHALTLLLKRKRTNEDR
jgi:putative methyltransferase (TIGR04325 family)